MIIKIPFSPFDIKLERVYKPHSTYGSEIEVREYDKVFCIGFPKTGTTTMEKLLFQFGFKLGDQAVAEILAFDWGIRKDTDRIIKYCYTADAFQDSPFGYPELYKKLDKAFPGSKFILTVRDTPESWYTSMVKYNTKKHSSDKNRPPDIKDLKDGLYRYKGYLYDSFCYRWNYPTTPLFDKSHYIQSYLNHIQDVRNYFKDRPDDLIEINVSQHADFDRLCDFLKVKTNLKRFPWENKT